MYVYTHIKFCEIILVHRIDLKSKISPIKLFYIFLMVNVIIEIFLSHCFISSYCMTGNVMSCVNLVLFHLSDKKRKA